MEHWRYLNIQQSDTLLDFGCGRWESNTYITTPEYFSDFCDSVYAFDYNQEEINWFKYNFKNNNKLKFYQIDLSNHNVIQRIYLDFNPTVVKCDIEKNEMHLLNINEDLFKTVRSYAIETHRNWIFDAFMSEFPKRGYEITAIINLTHAYPMKVIFAEKK